MDTGGGESPGAGRTLAGPAFPDDDGCADPTLRELLAVQPPSWVEQLRSRRLLVAVVAVADEVDAAGADKGSHMAVVSMISAAGEKGLLAFTGVDAMAQWDSAARPVAVTGAAAAQAALDDGAQALVIDVLGPARAVIAGPDLVALATRPDSGPDERTPPSSGFIRVSGPESG